MPVTAPARPAVFDRSAQHRRSMLAKINIARSQLNMDEDDYRQGLFDETGRTSLKECDDLQLDKMLTWLKSKGFRPIPKAKPKAATHPVARKARALWISLYHLGVVHNPSEEALETFAKRQLKCEHFSWARQSEGYRLIEALKAMANRNGWRQHGINNEKLSVTTLQSHLCTVILAKLKAAGAVPGDWTLEQAAFRLGGNRPDFSWPFQTEQYARLAEQLGRQLRALVGETANG